MATCIVSGNITNGGGAALEDVPVKANVTTGKFNSLSLVVPNEQSTETNGTGDWSLLLIRGFSYIVSIDYPPNDTDSTRRLAYTILVPNSSTANFSDLATEL